ncbi:MAG: SDR family oxidoreductase [Firmicutes bacterium]|nr:SDR family oxidoreductase [Bacillota bacterium]
MYNYKSLVYPRTALVIGGTRGIGKATVYAFANAGYRVAFCYKNSEKKANEIVFELQSKGYFVCGFKCDVSDKKQVSQLYTQIKNIFGNISTLICNAGVSQNIPFLNETPTTITNLLNQNFTTIVNCIKAFGPDMISNDFGRIITLSSVLANKGCSCESIYSASKGAVESFTKSLALEFAPHNITANSVAPGFIDTDMNSDLSGDEKQDFINRTMLKRAGTPEEIADAILFLSSENASYITGQVININGGM